MHTLQYNMNILPQLINSHECFIDSYKSNMHFFCTIIKLLEKSLLVSQLARVLLVDILKRTLRFYDYHKAGKTLHYELHKTSLVSGEFPIALNDHFSPYRPIKERQSLITSDDFPHTDPTFTFRLLLKRYMHF